MTDNDPYDISKDPDMIATVEFVKNRKNPPGPGRPMTSKEMAALEKKCHEETIEYIMELFGRGEEDEAKD